MLIDPAGFPDWQFQARASVRLPDPPAELTVDELRVVDVMAANDPLRRSAEDPLWTSDGATVAGTPQGWPSPA